MIKVKNTQKKGEKVSGDDYIYASAMVRTRENSRICYDALVRIAEAKDVSEICKILPEYSIEPIYTPTGELDAEETVTRYLAGEFAAIGKVMPQGSILDFLKIPYDCHNLKTVIKCTSLDRDNCEELLIDLGRVPAYKVKETVYCGDLSAFSENLAREYSRATKAFAESGDPKLIDSILDGACYADMLASVASYRNSYFKKLVEIKIDTTNIMTAVRTLRMGDTTGLFDSMFIGGASLDIRFFKKAMQSSEEELIDALKKKGYDLAPGEGEALSLTYLGNKCEEIYMKQVASAKDISFGAEVCTAYLIKASYATKMLRMAIAAKQTGVSASRIKEKIGRF